MIEAWLVLTLAPIELSLFPLASDSTALRQKTTPPEYSRFSASWYSAHADRRTSCWSTARRLF
jgi:hypothetical protein